MFLLLLLASAISAYYFGMYVGTTKAKASLKGKYSIIYDHVMSRDC